MAKSAVISDADAASGSAEAASKFTHVEFFDVLAFIRPRRVMAAVRAFDIRKADFYYLFIYSFIHCSLSVILFFFVLSTSFTFLSHSVCPSKGLYYLEEGILQRSPLKSGEVLIIRDMLA